MSIAKQSWKNKDLPEFPQEESVAYDNDVERIIVPRPIKTFS